jgi:hypothetical protein
MTFYEKVVSFTPLEEGLLIHSDQPETEENKSRLHQGMRSLHVILEEVL